MSATDLLKRKSWLKVVVLTGAGVSVASGLRPFRGLGGLYEEDPSLMQHLKAGAPNDKIWRFFAKFRSEVLSKGPSDAHYAIANFERALQAKGVQFCLITQNIDGFHQRAGSQNVVEIHGHLFRSKCSECKAEPWADFSCELSAPKCVLCGAGVRPDVVLFDEPIGAYEEVSSKRAFRGCDLFLAIGTSGLVWPASQFVKWADFEGAHTVFVNIEPLPKGAPSFDEIVIGKAENVLPDFFGF